jgi:hypothetical protein
MENKLYNFLVDIVKTKKVHRYEIPEDLIYDIIPKTNILSSIVIIEFPNNDVFLETLGVPEDDISVYDNFMSDYTNFYDDWRYDREYDDFREGYLWSELNQENQNLLEKIKMLFGALGPYENFERRIENFAQREVENMLEVVSNERSRCVHEAVKEILINETKNPFREFGIIQIYHGHKFKTTVGILIRLFNYVKNFVDIENFTLKDLLTYIFKRKNTDIGMWDELEYNAWCDDYNTDYINSEIKYEFEKIIDKIEESFSKNGTDNSAVKNIYELIDKVEKLGGFRRNIWVGDFLIVNFNKIRNNVLYMDIRKSVNGKEVIESRSAKNLEELNLILYHPELFESIKKNINKFLF